MTSPSESQIDVDIALQLALSREAAMRQILQVISRSREDVKPVFDAILLNAARLCDAPLAFLSMADDARTHVTVPAYLGVRPDFAAALPAFHEPMEGSELLAVRAISEGKVIRSDNLIDDQQYRTEARWRTELVETKGVRSILVVPLMRGDEAIGAIRRDRRSRRLPRSHPVTPAARWRGSCRIVMQRYWTACWTTSKTPDCRSDSPWRATSPNSWCRRRLPNVASWLHLTVQRAFSRR